MPSSARPPAVATTLSVPLHCVQGQVLIKNEYIGVNFTDTYFRSGLYPRPSYPAGLGEEGAGTVMAVGPGELQDEVFNGIDPDFAFNTKRHIMLTQAIIGNATM